MLFRSLGFGVRDLCFAVWGLVFGGWGLEFGGWGLGLGNRGLGVGSWGLGVGGWGLGVWELRFGVYLNHLPRHKPHQTVSTPEALFLSRQLGLDPCCDWLFLAMLLPEQFVAWHFGPCDFEGLDQLLLPMLRIEYLEVRTGILQDTLHVNR